MYRERKKRKIILIVLGLLLCVMGIGYSAFYSRLRIAGTTNIASNWDVRISNISTPTINGSAEEVINPTCNVSGTPKSCGDGLNVDMEVDLYEVGDSVEYDVTITNFGSIDATLDDFTIGSSEALKITVTGVTKGQIIYKNSHNGDSAIAHVKIEYNPSYTGGEVSEEVSVNFDYSQADVKELDEDEVISKDKYLVSYDCEENGGVSCSNNNEYLFPGSSVDLTKTATKEEYIFVGWNTDRNANTGLATYEMPSSNTTLYAIYEEDTLTIDNISTTSTTKSITVIVAASALSGIKKYEFSINNGAYIKSDNNGQNNMYTFDNLVENTDYSIKVRVTSNSQKTLEQEKTDTSCNVDEGTTYDFPYSGGEQTFTPVCRGTYTLEVWGAQGGSATYEDTSYMGGLGGYSVGETLLNRNETLYVNVGGQGTMANTQAVSGGYNGGGSATGGGDGLHYMGSGGGATHIATKSGLLSSLKKYTDNIYIVAGGGGGAYLHRYGYNGEGGNGGGMTGNQGTANKTKGAYGGTQTAGGTGYANVDNGVFGEGGSRANGGGGGYYGGGACGAGTSDYGLAGAGGGSGYIGNPKLTNKKMVCLECQSSSAESTKTENNAGVSITAASNCAKMGDGYAKITFGSKTITPYTNKIAAPTFAETTPGEVIITYPEGCGSIYTCKYKKNSEEYVTVTSNTTTVPYGESGTLLATVEDGYNIVSASYTLIKNDLYVKSDGNDSTGYGTINAPYATLAKAYEKAASTPSTIYVMDDITQTATTTMNSGKDITLTSCTKSGSNCNYSSNNLITRNSTLLTHMINNDSGRLTIGKITVDGNNVEATESAIVSDDNLSINNGSVITKCINSNDKGGAILIEGGSLTMNGGTLSYNEAYTGGAIRNEGTLTMNSGTISNNIASGDSGAIDNVGTLTIKGGVITSNTSGQNGGAIVNRNQLVLSGGEISHNQAPSGIGGAIASSPNHEIIMSNTEISDNTAKTDGGGIWVGNNGNLIISSGTITKNVSKRGGGIFVAEGATVNISGGTLSYNKALNTPTESGATAGEGGGIFSYTDSSLYIASGTISNNTAFTGGGMFVQNILNITGGTISDNKAVRDAGGIYGLSTSTITMKNNLVDGNVADRLCGGVDVDGTLTMSGNSQVINNTCTTNYDGSGGYAGGIRVGSNATFTMNGGTITGNTAATYGGGVGISTNGKMTVGNNNTIQIYGNINGSSSTYTYPENISFVSTGTTFTDSRSSFTIGNASYYVLSGLNNSYALDVKNGTVANSTNIQIYTKQNANRDKWKIYPRLVQNGKVYYGFASAIGGNQYMWVSNNSSTSGENVLTWQVHGSNGGFWSAEYAGAGYYYFKNKNGICLHAASNTNGANVTANTCNNSSNQIWKISTS